MSLNIRAEILAWLRFAKQYHYVATECGRWSADVVGSNGKTLIEVEIKVSKADFRRDFSHKNKHHWYANPTELNAWVPHRMYFAVPESLKEFALKELESKNPNYGLIVVSEDNQNFFGKSSSIAKKAKALHKFPVKPGVLEQFLARMSSDLCHLHENSSRYKRFEELALERSKQLSTLPDIEGEQDEQQNNSHSA